MRKAKSELEALREALIGPVLSREQAYAESTTYEDLGKGVFLLTYVDYPSCEYRFKVRVKDGEPDMIGQPEHKVNGKWKKMKDSDF